MTYLDKSLIFVVIQQLLKSQSMKQEMLTHREDVPSRKNPTEGIKEQDEKPRDTPLEQIPLEPEEPIPNEQVEGMTNRLGFIYNPLRPLHTSPANG